MLPSCSKTDQSQFKQPHKRKCEEYHDPDYVNALSTPTKRMCVPNQEYIPNRNLEIVDVNSDKHDVKYRRVCNIIEREFQREICLKIEQLEVIDDRLDKAFLLLDRLRYAIVADYYQKQTIAINAPDCGTVRGTQTLFENEPVGPQLALHPSIKKIVGKKPKTYEEILRSCPTRAAAKNAKQTILIKSQTTKKRERLLQQLIRDEGIVIDHSKHSSSPSIDPLSALNIAKQQAVKQCVNGLSTISALDKPRVAAVPTKSLNPSRLNNKTKCLIVVGNTSKYIGADIETQDQKTTNKALSHKWLVYVQAKNLGTPLELYVEKVRFFLHNSYRPNNIIDICSPPFQIARRGWGEFPIRIQLFFKESLQQKPIQLIHNLILDKTLSGIQTLGAETLVEIWLRLDVKPESFAAIKEEKQHNATSVDSNRKISYVQGKEIDDNLFEFLNQIEETPAALSADIEKIQPTVIVAESVNNISNDSNKIATVHLNETKSPKKASINNSNSNKAIKSFNNSSKSEANDIALIKSPIEESSVKPIQNGKIQPKAITFKINTEHKSDTNHTNTFSPNNIKILTPKNAIALSSGKTVCPETLTSSNAQNTSQDKLISNQAQTLHSFVSKKILQKKLVQLVDANGNIKYMQMLVATSTVPLTKTTSTASKTTFSSGSINEPKEERNKIVPLSTVIGNPNIKLSAESAESVKSNKILNSEISNSKLLPSALPNNSSSQLFSSNQSKNFVFQKEGKVFIIDPVQMKLKQQQKKQISLLKPQVSLLKQQQQQKQQQEHKVAAIIYDHDYVPAPSAIPIIKENSTDTSINKTMNKRAVNYPCVVKSTPFHVDSRPHLHLGIKHARDSANNALELLHKRRLELRKDFLQKQFVEVREAVEYLLRRLPLFTTQSYADQGVVFPFTSKSLEHFNSLPAFKQRAFEWLRAKFITSNLKSHTGLLYRNKNTNGLWTTKEVAMFARYHAYTPIIKSLKSVSDENSKEFTDLVKNELSTKQKDHYKSITSNVSISSWINSIIDKLENNPETVIENQSIDVVTIDVNTTKVKSKTNRSPTKFSDLNEMLYLNTPEYLGNETNLVSDICKQLNINLQTEEIVKGVIHPITQTLLAICLRLFIEKLLRNTLAFKKSQKSSATTSVNNSKDLIESHEIGSTIILTQEFDFLSNRHLGNIKSPDEFSSK